MYPILRLQTWTTRKIVPLFLALILIGCATPTSSSSNRTPTIVTSSPPVMSAVTVQSAKVDGAFIRSTGFQCPLRTPYTGFDAEYTMQRLVLAENRLTYKEAEIQQMRAYLKGRGGLGDYSILSQEPVKKIPSTLHLVQGGSQCTIHLQITNIANEVFQINLAGIQLIGKPRPNTYQYRAIDICSITGDCVAASGPGACSVFGVAINLGPDITTSATAKPTNLQPQASNLCRLVYVEPKGVVDFNISLTSAKPYIYSIIPILSFNNSKGSRFVKLTSMVSSIAFVTRSQLSCYKLQGTQFMQEPLNPNYKDFNCNFPDIYP